jgi:uncharacterized protein YgiB involved in biofilm formation
MKRSTQLKLGLVSTLPVALAACTPMEETISGTMKKTYNSVQQCVDDKMPVDVCSDAFMNAMAEHKRIAPTYRGKQECEADFVPEYCAETSNGLFMPKLGGFEIATEFNAPASQVQQLQNAYNAGQSSGGGGGGNDLLTGLLIGNMLSSGNARYYSEPVYVHRDSRGAFERSTLSRRIEAGKTFQRSTQVAGGATYASNKNASITSALKRPTTINTKPVTVSSSSNRGGFGSQSAARSGWGFSGGRSSFGG